MVTNNRIINRIIRVLKYIQQQTEYGMSIMFIHKTYAEQKRCNISFPNDDIIIFLIIH